MNVIATVKGGTVFCVTGTYLAVVAVRCFVWFPGNISTWSWLLFCLFGLLFWFFFVLFDLVWFWFCFFLVFYHFHMLEETIFWEALDAHIHFPKMWGYGSENLTSPPWWTGEGSVFFLLASRGLCRFSFYNVVDSAKMDITSFYSVVHINRHISCLFSGKGETGKPKFQNCVSHVDGSLWAWLV